MQHFQNIVIGAGQGGALAKKLALAGQKTALIERRWLGGSCINWGCTPTKTMVASARVAHLARRGAFFGVHTSTPNINLKQIRKRKREMVEDFRGDYEASVGSADKLEIFHGQARFVAPKTVEVTANNGDKQSLSAETIIISTGTSPALPEISGLQDNGFLTAETVMELDKVPEHLIVLGGGYIGLEFAQMFHRFGAKVTVLQRNTQILSHESPDVAGALQTILEEEGLDIHLNCSVTKVNKEGKVLSVTAKSAHHEFSIEGSHLLVAAGHVPNTVALEPANAGIETDDKGFIKTDEFLRSSAEGVYVVGDVKGGPQFTHIAFDDTRILEANLLHGQKRPISGRIVPYVVFTDPQLGRAGLSEKAAKKAGYNIRVAKILLDQTARALETGETHGFLKAIIDDDTDQILGGAMLSAEGGEIMATLQVAMRAKMPYQDLRDGIFAHPTQVEALNNLFLKMDRER